jgi:Uma2 family endonuclease
MMTYSEYLSAEATADVRHEFRGGHVIAMAGGSPEHAGLAMSVGAALSHGLRGKPCRVFSADLRVRVQATDLSTYPDVTVVCGGVESAPDDRDAVVNPIVIVEVLSPSTESWDRGEKFAHYRNLPSFREYLLVSQNERRLELYRRDEAGDWEMHEARAGDSIEIRCIGVWLDVDQVYRDPFIEEMGPARLSPALL